MFKLLKSKIMNAEISIDDIDVIIKKCDMNHNGKISVKELILSIENLLL